MSTNHHVADEANWLLSALPPAAYERVLAHCEPISLGVGDVIFQPDEPIGHAYFPRSGCLSVVTTMVDGTAVEVGTIGWDGMGGISLLHGVTEVPTRCFVQVAGHGVRIPTNALAAELRDHGELRGVLERYTQVWVDMLSRSTACNAVHSVDQRCARWLLMTHDRVEGDLVPLTQGFLAIMLGVRRASVTLAASALQEAGLITYKHGKITVRDRDGLEAAACECYAAIRSRYERLLPPSTRAQPTSGEIRQRRVGTNSYTVRIRTEKTT